LIPFTKAHACGNDFLIVTEEAAHGHDWAELTQRLCARNTGIGADGIEFFHWTGPHSGRIRLHNADGSIAEISGNGTRCVAAWMARELDAEPGDELHIKTDAGLRICRVNSVKTTGEYTVQMTAGMGVPTFAPRTVTIPGGQQVPGVEVSTGNPHFRHRGRQPRVPSLRADLAKHRPADLLSSRFSVPDQRGVPARRQPHGDRASGTGSSATSTAAIALNGCQSPLAVVAPGGAQTVAWEGPGSELYLTGPAALIARGEAW
jgi:diaminopimelate epimerase